MNPTLIVINSVIWGSVGLSWLISEIREEFREEIRKEARTEINPIKTVNDYKVI